MEKYLAKSEKYGLETIEEHTLNLVKNHEVIKKQIKNDKLTENFWRLSKVACLLHDLGKYNDKFQTKIQREDYSIEGEIPHAFLSVAFIPEIFSEDDELLLIYSIAYHHERKLNFSEQEYKETVNNDLSSKIKELLWLKHYNLNIESLFEGFYNYFDRSANTPYKDLINIKNTYLYQTFIYLKGLLHKCDYSASAHLTPEKIYDGNYNKDFDNWLPFELKDFQKDAKTLSEQNKSVVLVASTGVGKTEYSMNWINGNKTFYLLGLRMATNKMYERFSKIFNGNNNERENVTLLHSTAGNILMDETDDVFSYFNKSKEGRQLSYPITIATADQLVTSVFKYPGFELKYFTASYSYIVVDEIQSFAPEAIASIIVFLQDIHKLGGRFLLMTATLPPFVKDDLKNLTDIEFPEHKDQLSDKKRHKIELIEEKIEENILDYVEDSKKILIICNTVKKAQEIAEVLESSGFTPKLLHSKFIVKDRAEKENEIMNDAPNGKGGEKSVIWISTQIVEASLDIDFDLLLTENATIDSLLQRFGRCYRDRSLETPPLGACEAKSNIFIFKNDEISERIYDKEIMNRTWDILLSCYNKKLITEVDKQNIIDEVFKTGFIENTKYHESYIEYKRLLHLGYRADTKRKAQEDFRKIMNSYLVIPNDIYCENCEKIDDLIELLDSEKTDDIESREFWEKRIESERELMGFTIGVQLYPNQKELYLNDSMFNNSNFCKKRKIFFLDNCSYSYENGLILDDKTNVLAGKII